MWVVAAVEEEDDVVGGKVFLIEICCLGDSKDVRNQ